MIMSTIDKLLSEVLEEQLPSLVGEAMAEAMVESDSDVLGEALAWRALVIGETGLLNSLGRRDWRHALEVTNTGIDMAIRKHGPYYTWNRQTKERFGYMLGYFYLNQAVSLAECGRINEALNTSIPKAQEIQEASPTLRASIRELGEELKSIQRGKKAR